MKSDINEYYLTMFEHRYIFLPLVVRKFFSTQVFLRDKLKSLNIIKLRRACVEMVEMIYAPAVTYFENRSFKS